MRRALLLCIVFATASGCLGPVQDFSLGTLDGGADRGAGGGSGGAGGGAGGGASGGAGGGGAQDAGPTDAGTVIVITDAGLVPANPNLPMGNCGTVLTLPGSGVDWPMPVASNCAGITLSGAAQRPRIRLGDVLA